MFLEVLVLATSLLDYSYVHYHTSILYLFYIDIKESSRNITRKASKMVDKENISQRDASAAIDSGDNFSHQSTQAMDNYDNFDQTMMGLEVSQTEDPLSRAPQPGLHYGTMERPTGRLAHNVSLSLIL